jgi:hypothetical protein
VLTTRNGGGNLTLDIANNVNASAQNFNMSGYFNIQPAITMGTPSAPVTITGSVSIQLFTMIGNKLYATITGASSGSAGFITILLPTLNPATAKPFCIVDDQSTGLPGQGFNYNTNGTLGIPVNRWYYQAGFLGLGSYALNILIL